MRNASVAALACCALLAWWLLRGSKDAHVAPPANIASEHTAASVPKPRATTAITGRVVSAGQPVAGASVAVSDRRIGLRGVALADREGRFRIAIPAGTYAVGATADGYLPGFVTAATTDAPVELALVAGGLAVTGTVSDISGGPLVGALVSADVDDASIAVATTAEGRYHLTLAAGEHYLSANHEDYVGDRQEVIVVDKTTRCDFVLGVGAEITGRVLARDGGAPIANAEIDAESTRGAISNFAHAIADDDGRFVVRGVAPGAVALTVTMRGWSTTEPVKVLLGIGERADDVIVRVAHAFSIRGTLVDGDNAPIGKGGYVYAARSGAGIVSSSFTDERGRFEIVGLLPDAYELQDDRQPVDVRADIDNLLVRASGHRRAITGRVEPVVPTTISIFFDTTRVDASGAFTMNNYAKRPTVLALSDDHRVAAALAEPGRDLVLHLGVGVAVRGAVVDTAGRPVAGARVSATVANHDWWALADSSGAFSFAGLPPLVGSFSARDRDNGSPRQTDLDLAQPTADLKLVIPRHDRTLHGEVRAADGRPMADVLVDVAAPGMSWRNTAYPTRADGSFDIPDLSHEPCVVTARTAHGDGFASSRVGPDDERVQLTLGSYGSIEGTVRADGRIVDEVSLVCGGDFRTYSGVQPGAFRIDGLEPGDYTCLARAAGRESYFNAKTGATVEVSLPLSRVVHGELVDALTNAPLANVTVAASSVSTRTDARGQFELVGAPDHGSIELTADGSLLDFRDFGIGAPAGERIELGTIKLVVPVDDAVGHVTFDYALEGGVYGANGGGIIDGDIIIAIDGVVLNAKEVRSVLSRGLQRGRTYKLTLARGVTVEVTAR